MNEDEQLVLVGFGRFDLAEVLSWRGSSREEDAILAAKKWPPRYRRKAICEPGDVERFVEYANWLSSFNFKDYIAF
jgi:hypothetical protein